MRLGILTGDDGWGDDDRPYAGNEIVGGQLRRIQRHQREGCPCTHGQFGIGWGACGDCGKNI